MTAECGTPSAAVGFIGFLFGLCLVPEMLSAQHPGPNVILMMADDLAYDDLSCFGSERIRSPHLDQMAQEGMRLTGFYAGASVCSPSRMALLSGAYPARLGWQRGVLGYGMKPNTGLSPQVVTLAEIFQGVGYRTAIVGKWHVGDKNLRPHRQGFESTYYLLASNNIGRDIYRNDQVVHKAFDNRRLTETFTEEVIRIIESESDRPFFMYVPFSAPHFPAEAHPDWQGNASADKLAAYVSVVEELDHRIGQILDAVKKKGIDDETLIVFISDNGAQAGQRVQDGAGPFSGMKWSSREGGTRVPAILRWPGVIKEGQVHDQMVAAIDLYPTLAAACGIPIRLPDTAQKIDGINLWANLSSPTSGRGREELLYWHGFGEATAIRQGDYKLFFGSGQEHSADPDITEGPALFNLADDPGETHDLRESHPEKVEELLELARQKLEDIEDNRLPLGRWPGTSADDEDSDRQPAWGKWLH